MTLRRDAASFRDDAGKIFHLDGRILRALSPDAARDYAALKELFSDLELKGWLIASREVPVETLQGEPAAMVLEHPVLPIISYPYEWGFPALKAAAILTLDVHIASLKKDAMMIDASAFNIQFRGVRPVFIDVLSLRRYRDGELWRAQDQFCRHFLNPLLLWTVGLVPNDWYRGTMEGISSPQTLAVLPLRRKLSWTVLSNLVLPCMLQQRTGGLGGDANDLANRTLPQKALIAMLQHLRTYIAGLQSSGAGSLWRDYERHKSYRPAGQQRREELVQEFSARIRPTTLWDMGCNTGHLARLALVGGAARAVGFDSDPDSINIAFAQASADDLDFLPLLLDAANPSPDQGWRQAERMGLDARRNADAVFAFAFLHHLVVGRHIPLDEAIAWLVSLAPRGLIEFVPPDDPMVTRMVALRREPLVRNYDEAAFINCLERQARIVARHNLPDTGRRVFEFSASTA